MSTPRHRAREVALQLLYRYELSEETGGPLGPEALPRLTPSANPRELAADLKRHFEHFDVQEGAQEFAAQLVAGTLEAREELDALIEKHSANWKLSRMSSIDRNLLRMATYELLHFRDTPPSVTIDEAIELGKQFGTQDSPGFVNGILDAIRAEKIAAL